MLKLYIAIEKALAVVIQRSNGWEVDLKLTGTDPQCLAVDPLHHEQIYCGTFDRGLWRSSDTGASWEHIGASIPHERILSVAVSPLEQFNGYGVVYAGTEPSAIFRSEDRGTTWRDLADLRRLPSAPTWSFPPRPYTSHIRCITPDPVFAGRVFAAVEAGALVRSLDGGETWEDRKPGGPFDTHTLVMPRQIPNRLYSAAGDGFMRPGNGFVQSDDGGETWYRPNEGFRYNYLWSVVVDPVDAETLVVSAAPGPQQAHNPMSAESAIYRRSHDHRWQQVEQGLPDSRGMLASALAAHEAEPHTFYAGNNRGIYRSADSGQTWEELSIPWPTGTRVGRVHALVAVME
ncbi:MAG TPA: glycosyl hydrolase [Ktedonobacteraceae bacterium]|nr:glycosyl hydrolase [Ktedonobacteraceae bacterium]